MKVSNNLIRMGFVRQRIIDGLIDRFLGYFGDILECQTNDRLFDSYLPR